MFIVFSLFVVRVLKQSIQVNMAGHDEHDAVPSIHFHAGTIT